jgi:hypothetical protein
LTVLAFRIRNPSLIVGRMQVSPMHRIMRAASACGGCFAAKQEPTRISMVIFERGLKEPRFPENGWAFKPAP